MQQPTTGCCVMQGCFVCPFRSLLAKAVVKMYRMHSFCRYRRYSEAVARMRQCPSGDADASNQFFVNLLDHRISLRDNALDEPLDCKGYVFMEDFTLIVDPEYNAFVQVFVENKEVFEHVFAKAWTEIMNADRYNGPVANICSKYYAKY